MLGDPAHQCRQVGRDAKGGRKLCRMINGQFVDHRQSRLKAGAMLGKDGAIKGGAEYDAASFLQASEGFRPSRGIRSKARSGDRDETTALLQPRKRCGVWSCRGLVPLL